LDAFTKVTEEAEAPQTLTGGFFSALAFTVMGILFLCEIWIWFWHTNIRYDFDVDVNFESKLNLNFDITVNSPCFGVGADIMDSSGDTWKYMVQINEEGRDFELPENLENSRLKQIELKNILHQRGADLHKALLRNGYDSSHLERAKKSGDLIKNAKQPLAHVIEIKMDGTSGACRFWGSIPLHKVAGVFQILPGKTIPLPIGPARMNFFGNGATNFSHRIDHFSFGEPSSGLLYPLDGEKVIQDSTNEQFNYIVNVVPTKLRTNKFDQETYQYAVTQHIKKSEHEGSGITIKYDFAGLGVEITESREKFSSLITRLCGILGGIFASSGILSSLISCLHQK